MKTTAALMFGMPESMCEIVERRDKIRSQVLNFAPYLRRSLVCFEPLRAAKSKFAERGSAICEQAIKFKAALCSRALKFCGEPSQTTHEI